MDRIILSLAVCLAAAGCSAAIAQKEDMLSAAGFQSRPADTPQRVAALRSLPAHRFVRQVRGDQQFWLYADPTVCRCVYAGDDRAYSRYRQEVFQQRIADENRFAAQEYRDAAMAQFEMGPWAPWDPFYN